MPIQPAFTHRPPVEGGRRPSLAGAAPLPRRLNQNRCWCIFNGVPFPIRRPGPEASGHLETRRTQHKANAAMKTDWATNP